MQILSAEITNLRKTHVTKHSIWTAVASSSQERVSFSNSAIEP